MGAYRLGKLLSSFTALLASIKDEFLAASLLIVGFTVCFPSWFCCQLALLGWDEGAFVVQRRLPTVTISQVMNNFCFACSKHVTWFQIALFTEFTLLAQNLTIYTEQASTGRAGCKNKECKDQGIKILKGELRHGSWVDTERFQSYFWRHW